MPATSSAPRRRFSLDALPIRWRLAAGSAGLTLVILCAFAVGVGLFTTRQIRSDFENQVSKTAETLRDHVRVANTLNGGLQVRGNLAAYAAAEDAKIRLLTLSGDVFLPVPRDAPDLGFPRDDAVDYAGYRVESRLLPVIPSGGRIWLQYARPLSEVRHTVSQVRILLLLGVLAGAALAGLAGLAIARRAMAPIADLTASAREIARTRDPSRRVPVPAVEDEVAELARTLDGMLAALDAARGETEATLSRQREFVADASHELRTPLTSVLANLELLHVELEGDQRATAASALRSTQRMRRLVGDLLLLARADAGRRAPHRPTDLAEVLVDAAAELEPVAEDYELTVTARPALVEGARDELHRLALNLLENAVRHTPPGTHVRAEVGAHDGAAVLSVQDDGPGVPALLRARLFERFVRGQGEAGGGSGLGLAIVRAVAEAHGGHVELEDPVDGTGARFVVRIPAASPARATVPS